MRYHFAKSARAVGLLSCFIAWPALAIGQQLMQGFWCDVAYLVPGGQQLTTLASGDVDGDGDIDVVGAAFVGGDVTIFWNDGTGGLTTTTVLDAGTALWSIRLADLDGLGDSLDIIASDDVGEAIYVFYASPSGFTKFTIATPTRCTALEVADFDGNGVPDIAGGSDLAPPWRDSVWVYLNNGTGGFDPGARQSYYFAAPGFLGTDRYEAGDVDQDGDIDLVLATGDSGAGWKVMVNNRIPSGQFSLSAGQAFLLTSDLGGGYPWGLALADYDNDVSIQYPDLVFSQIGSADSLRVAYNNDDGTPAFNVSSMSKRVTSGDVWDIDAADANADGFIDIIAARPEGPTIAGWFLKGMAGTLESSKRKPLHMQSIAGSKGATFGDLDGNGVAECLLGVTYPPSRLVVFFDCSTCRIFRNGDVNLDTVITATDINYLTNNVFKSGEELMPCAAAGDVNCTGTVNSADITYLVNYVFKSGTTPCDTICNMVGIGLPWDCRY